MECHLIHDDSCCLSSIVSKEMREASDSATVNDTVLNAPTMAWHPILCTFSNWFLVQDNSQEFDIWGRLNAKTIEDKRF